MIKRLQIKIVALIMGTLLLVFASVLIVLNLTVYQTSMQRAEEFLSFVVQNDGLPPPRETPSGMPGTNRPDSDMDRPRPDLDGELPLPNMEMMRGGRFFYVKMDEDGNIFEEALQFMFDFGSDDALGYATSAFGSGAGSGSIGNFSFIVAKKTYGWMLAFIERSSDILFIEQLSRMSIWAAGIAGLVLACLSAFLAKWITDPIKNSLDKQRRFVLDAGHELKTPLTIISANADVLQNEIGDNKRIGQIKSQTGRMNGLVLDLLTLAKADEGQENKTTVRRKFDLSGAVLNTALEHESRAFEEGKKYECRIDGGITYNGDEKQIKQLATIMIDNAIRYSDDGGLIEVSLKAEGSRIRISVFNTGVGVPDDERNKIFERFYRTDESRSRETGGYGIGLSIAWRIVETHKGRIEVKGEHMKWICFDTVL